MNLEKFSFLGKLLRHFLFVAAAYFELKLRQVNYLSSIF